MIFFMKPMLLLVGLFAAVTSASAKTFSGTLRDPSGAAIANAHVIVHWDPSGSNYLKDNLGIAQDINATTDSQGRFTVNLPPGFYDVFVSAMAFAPHCEKVRIKDKDLTTYEAKLNLSPVT